MMKQYKLVFTEFKLKTATTVKIKQCWELEFDLLDQALWEELIELAGDVFLENPSEIAPTNPEEWFDEVFCLIFNFKKSSFKKIDGNDFVWNSLDFPGAFLPEGEDMIRHDLKDSQEKILRKYIS
jgi:hypothetical protein